jgi:hypothetical protein
VKRSSGARAKGYFIPEIVGDDFVVGKKRQQKGYPLRNNAIKTSDEELEFVEIEHYGLYHVGHVE